jgi:hypothetical protein
MKPADPKGRQGQAMEREPRNAFITARKGFCYLTIKSFFGRNHEMMRIRSYTLDAEDKRRMRRLYPEVAFDWTAITRQLAVKRAACRRYRSRRRSPHSASQARGSEAFYGVYEPGTRTVYANGVPSSAAGVGALLDAVLRIDCALQDDPSPLDAPLGGGANPWPELGANDSRPKPRRRRKIGDL